MTRILTLGLVACVSLSLGACSNTYWPDTYSYPTGYTHHDITPVSTPHGYDMPVMTEQREEIENSQNAEAWRNAIGSLITPVIDGLDANRPIAVIPVGGASPLNTSAMNYTRDMLVKMGYLVAVPAEAGQAIAVRTVPAHGIPGMIDLTLEARRGDHVAAQNTGRFAVPHQVVETSRLPGLTHYPASGPMAKPSRDQTYN